MATVRNKHFWGVCDGSASQNPELSVCSLRLPPLPRGLLCLSLKHRRGLSACLQVTVESLPGIDDDSGPVSLAPLHRTLSPSNDQSDLTTCDPDRVLSLLQTRQRRGPGAQSVELLTLGVSAQVVISGAWGQAPGRAPHSAGSV